MSDPNLRRQVSRPPAIQARFQPPGWVSLAQYLAACYSWSDGNHQIHRVRVWRFYRWRIEV
jgi:hypothetical protein